MVERKRQEGLTVFCDNLVKNGYDQLLEGGSGGIIDDAILARLQDEANVQGSNEEIPLNIDGIVLKQGGQGLQDLELGINTSRGGFTQGFKNGIQPRAGQGADDNQAQQANDGNAGKLDILGSTGYDKGVHEIDLLREFYKVSRRSTTIPGGDHKWHRISESKYPGIQVDGHTGSYLGFITTSDVLELVERLLSSLPGAVSLINQDTSGYH